MNCKVCIHYDVCYDSKHEWERKKCEHFKDKSKLIELPCRVGDKVWWNTGLTIWERIVKGIIVYQNTMRLDLDNFQPIVNHESLIYSEEEAEQKLKELNG